ncbi:MAG: hypothetical protein ED559_04910 [Phycisphaera sp.]|nr:MAG: hypothetical protein ED559_04910 [Phycisphaera sp.]
MKRGLSILVPWLCLAAALAGCESAFDRHRDSLLQAHERGQYALAGDMLEAANEKGLYSSKSRVLWLLERGAAAAAEGDSETALVMLNAAEAETELFNEQSISDLAGQWLLSERATKYITRAYEEQYINVIKMIAHYQAGRTENGPTVEARRMALKANEMRDRYAELLDELKDRGGEVDVQYSSSAEFIESPLGVYLSAVAFIENGESEMASTAIRRLESAAAAQAGLGISADTSYAGTLEGLESSEADALFVALGGVGPTLARQSIGPYFVYLTPIYFELPQIVPGGTGSSRAIAEIEYADGTTGEIELRYIEDFSAVAEANFAKELPAVHARTYLRALTKSGIFTAGGVILENSDADSGVKAAGLLVSVVGGLLYLAATEKADIRSWTMLPGAAWASVTDLPEGAHRARVVFIGQGGQRLHAGEWKQVRGGRFGLDSIIEYWSG